MAEPRTILPSGRDQPRFAGIATFGRWPRLQDVDDSRLPCDWCVFGAPFDNGVTYRPGARFGPRSIRDESQYLKPYHLVHDLTLSEVFSLADAGDAPVRPYSAADNAAAVTEFATKLATPGHTRLMMLGGDHSNSYAAMKAAWIRRGKKKGGLALLHFDSHLDTVDAVWGEKYGHASPFIRLVEEGVLDPRRMLSIGIKGPLNTRDDLDYARDHGVTILTCEQWRNGGTAVIDDFLGRLDGDDTYLTFDIDCIDPAYAPGTGTPSVGGFTSAEALALLRHLGGHAARFRLVGADVVEVLPDRDVAGNTALLAAHIAFEIICLDALRQGGSVA